MFRSWALILSCGFLFQARGSASSREGEHNIFLDNLKFSMHYCICGMAHIPFSELARLVACNTLLLACSSMAGGSNSSTTPAANAPNGLGPASSFTPGFGNGSTFGSPASILNPLDDADSVLSGARRALCVLLLVLPLFFL